MTKKELLEIIKDIEDDKDIDNVLKETDFAKSILNKDTIIKQLNEDKELKSYIDSVKDKHYSKALETWKANNLPKIIQEEIEKQNPTTPENKKLAELENKIKEMEKEKTRAELKAVALNYATENKLPTDILDFFIAEDKDATISNLDQLKNTMSSSLEKLVEDKVKGNVYVPPKNEGEVINTYDSILKNADKMTAEEVAEQLMTMSTEE